MFQIQAANDRNNVNKSIKETKEKGTRIIRVTDPQADLKEVYKRLGKKYHKKLLEEALHEETGEVVLEKLPRSPFTNTKE